MIQPATSLMSLMSLMSFMSLMSLAAPPAPEFFIAPDGRPENAGTRESPWDIVSGLSGAHAVPPGSTVWLRGGVYRHPNRSVGAMGFDVKLAGQEGAPIRVQAVPGAADSPGPGVSRQ